MALHDRDYMRGRQPFRWSDVVLPDAVTALIILNVLVFFMQHAFGIAADRAVNPVTGKTDILPWGALSWDALHEGRVWTLVTHLFVHDNLLHLVGNCVAIFFTGKAVQALLGVPHFLYVFFFSGVVGAAVQIAEGFLMKNPQAVMGSTAAAYGTFLALAAMLPQESVSAMLHFVLPVRLRLWTLAVLAMGISFMLALLQMTRVWPTDVAHFAHLGGALTGWYIVYFLGYSGPAVTYDRMRNERQRNEEARAYAGVPRRKRTATVAEEPSVSLPPAGKREFIEQEIDPILDKIAAHGISSLSHEERSLLGRAREEIIKRERP